MSTSTIDWGALTEKIKAETGGTGGSDVYFPKDGTTEMALVLHDGAKEDPSKFFNQYLVPWDGVPTPYFLVPAVLLKSDKGDHGDVKIERQKVVGDARVRYVRFTKPSFFQLLTNLQNGWELFGDGPVPVCTLIKGKNNGKTAYTFGVLPRKVDPGKLVWPKLTLTEAGEQSSADGAEYDASKAGKVADDVPF